ncbi:hypothetical protein ACFLT9_11690 [Acidobacteriota bacterium]
MKKRKILSLVFYFAVPLIMSGLTENRSQEIEDILNRVGEKTASYNKLDRFNINIISTLFTMDKEWKPTKIESVEKVVTIDGTRRTEEVISAIEKKNGKVKDLTRKYQRDAQKAREKALKEPEEAQKRGRRDLDLTLKEYIPFTPTKRREFSFRLIGESQLGGQPIYLIGATSLTESNEIWNGTYSIHKESFDILRAEISPSKKPGVLKQFRMELDFQILPGNYLALLKSKIRIHVGLVVKNIRVIAEESYSDYSFQLPD